jgi:hypothetical protein
LPGPLNKPTYRLGADYQLARQNATRTAAAERVTFIWPTKVKTTSACGYVAGGSSVDSRACLDRNIKMPSIGRAATESRELDSRARRTTVVISAPGPPLTSADSTSTSITHSNVEDQVTRAVKRTNLLSPRERNVARCRDRSADRLDALVFPEHSMNGRVLLLAACVRRVRCSAWGIP